MAYGVTDTSKSRGFEWWIFFGGKMFTTIADEEYVSYVFGVSTWFGALQVALFREAP